MGLLSDLVTSSMGGYPSKPVVPPLTQVTAGGAQTASIAENLSALPQLESLASQTNLFNDSEIQSMLQRFIPGYTDISKTASGNIQDLLSGKVPSDVSAAVTQSDAAKALSGGYSGSGMHGSLVARDLGLTSLDLTQKGLGEAAGWISMMDRVASPGHLNVTSMFVSPQMELGQENLQAQENWNVDWMKNQLAAIPDPAKAAIARDVGGVVGMAAGDPMEIIGGLGGMGGVMNMASALGKAAPASSAGALDTGASVDYGGEMAAGGGGAAAAGGGL